MPVQHMRAIHLVLSVLLVAGGCASLPTGFDKPETRAFTDTDSTFLGQESRRARQGHPDLAGFYALGNGLDAFVARAVLARTAERSIDAQY